MRRVWIDSWQMQCCGDPFGVGSEVSWSTLVVTDASWFAEFLQADIASAITDCEEHHSDDNRSLGRVSGVARSIDAVFCRYRLDGRAATPIAGSGVLEPRSRVDGWEDEDELGVGLTFVGYLVELETADV